MLELNTDSMADELKFTEKLADTEEDRNFDKAVETILSTGKRDYPCYVGGLKVASGRDFPVCSPVDKSIIFGTFQEPDEGLTDRAVVVAKEAFKTWSKTSPEERTAIFDKVYAKVDQQRDRLAAMVTLSVGMTRDEAYDEVDTLLDILAKACDDIEEKKGKADGVWAILTSFNSPLAAPVGYACAAMIAGNTVVMIPAAEAPLPVFTFYDYIMDAGLPEGVLNVIVDRTMKGEFVTALANNLDVSGVVAAGSGKIMEDLMFLQMDDELRFINEIKGMDPIFVNKPGSMKEAAKIIIKSAFSYAGQHLSSCSKVVVTEAEEKELINALLAEVKEMKISDPTSIDTYCGPVISERKVSEYKTLLNDVKAYVAYGGKKVSDELTENGFYVTPAIIMGLDMEHDLNNMDSAMPILSIQTVADVDEAIDVINCTEYGSCAGIITKDVKLSERFVDEVNADEIVINEPTTTVGVASKAVISNFME